MKTSTGQMGIKNLQCIDHFFSKSLVEDMNVMEYGQQWFLTAYKPLHDTSCVPGEFITNLLLNPDGKGKSYSTFRASFKVH